MKKLLGAVLTLILAFTFASCSKQPAQTLTIGILPDLDSIPLVIAQNNGYFEKEGVKIELKKFNSARERDSALQAGQIDGAISDALAAAFAKDGGFDVRITSKTDGSYKLLVNKDSSISNLSELKGKSIAISTNTIIEYTTDMFLNKANLTQTDVKKTAIPQIPTRLEMLQKGKVDAATLPEPLASVAVKNGAKLLNSSDALKINPGVILFTSKSIEDKSTEIKAMYKAYNDAVSYLEKEQASSYIDTLIEKAGFPADVKGTLTLPKYTKAVMIDNKDFTDVITWLKDKKLIKNSYEYKDLVEDKFVR